MNDLSIAPDADETTTVNDTLDLARQHAYWFMSLATSDPKSARWSRLRSGAFQDAATAAGELLAASEQCRPTALAPGELPPARLDFAAALSLLPADARVVDAYERVFGLMISKKAPPYETEYCPQNFSVYRSQQLADVSGFYLAFGVQPSRDMPERHDHVSLELEFMAWLISRERHALACGGADAADRAAACRDAQKAFFRDHLAWWVPAFALALRRVTDRVCDERHLDSPPASFYGAVGCCLAAFVAAERALLDLAPPTELVRPQEAADADEPGCNQCGLHSVLPA